MLTTKQQEFQRACRDLGVHSSETYDHMDRPAVFIHFDDCPTKTLERKTTKLAKQYGMKITIADKGAIFA